MAVRKRGKRWFVDVSGKGRRLNILPVYSVGCERGVHFYAMQFVDGPTLADVIGELKRGAEGSEVRGQGSGDRGFGVQGSGFSEVGETPQSVTPTPSEPEAQAPGQRTHHTRLTSQRESASCRLRLRHGQRRHDRRG